VRPQPAVPAAEDRQITMFATITFKDLAGIFAAGYVFGLLTIPVLSLLLAGRKKK
jgi:hypothetical protein